MKKTVMMLGPSTAAVSGVSTHLNQLFHSALAQQWELVQFQVGSEGRAESTLSKLWRFAISPLQFAVAICRLWPAIVHLNTSLEPKSYWRDIVYLLIAKLFGRRVLYQVHGGALPEQFFAGQPMRRWLLRRMLRLADAVVLLADIELQAYRQFDPRLVLSVIPNAIDLVPDPAGKEQQLQGPLTVAYVGRLARNKGIFELLDALALVRREGVALQLVIAGGGPDEAELRAAVERLALADQVRFAGPVFGKEKDELWARADVFGFPTYHREGLPYALLESMAARTVPLVCPVGAVPDVMQDGEHGVFVPPRDPAALAAALLRLERDRALLRRMGAAGRQRIEQAYTVERLARDFDAAYTRLCTEH
ncbi:glycosyltransferase [Pseudoduganella sp. FT93W]|uniref:Glycosyltransferase n=1 Tax=Duganella fentianensis TaxID=2692177 RepID=A0A845I672_9BURK|nr:glycosyltransferase family 4 protein [Duganella fentianensis]MYN47386.1 glycosyltransferase [Duganella fentianensis]